jgi:hypothetical protein
MRGIGQDVKLALRIFSKAPAFAAIVILTLALGSGANTAIFTLLDQVMLRALPVERPDRLVVLSAPGPYTGWSEVNSTAIPVSHPMFEGLRDKTAAFSGVLAHVRGPVHLALKDGTERVNGDLVSGGFFQVLGLRPAHGRLFTPDDDRVPSGHPIVVLGHDLFERGFGGDPSAIGRTVNVNNHPMTIVGVAPEGFDGIEVGTAVDVYVPLAMQQELQPTWGKRLGDWRSRFLTPVARLVDGVSLGAPPPTSSTRSCCRRTGGTSKAGRRASRSASSRSSSSSCPADAAPRGCANSRAGPSSC